MSAPEPTTAARTVRELVEALTKLAGELPRGLDTPVEVGLIVDTATFDASAAFSVEPVTATWPGFRPDGAECRHTTVCLIGDPGHPDADRYTRLSPSGLPGTQPTDPHRISERRAEPGERCTCGRQAIVVYLGGAFGPTGHCGIRDDGDQEAEEAARSLLPTRRHDMVGTWPSEKLGELIEQRPDLLPELIRRRPSEVSQA